MVGKRMDKAQDAPDLGEFRIPPQRSKKKGRGEKSSGHQQIEWNYVRMSLESLGRCGFELMFVANATVIVSVNII